MSTIKSDTLQPTLSGNNLILKTGSGDVERLRITPTGTMTVASGVGTVFAGGVSFSAPLNVNGKMGIGSAYGGTPVVDLDVVSGANASLLDPQLNTYTTTQGRAVAAFRTSATNTTLFFGNSGVSAAWLQVQNSDNTQRSLALNPVGGNVGIGTTGPVVALDVVGGVRVSGGLTADSFVSVGSNLTVGGSATASTAFSAPNTPKAWAIVQNGTTLVAGYNVSSVSSSGGRVYINFPAGVFPDGNWCVVCTSAVLDANEIVRPIGVGNNRTATQCELYCTGIGGSSTLVQTLAASPHQLVYAVFYHL